MSAGSYDDALSALGAADSDSPPIAEMRARIQRERSEQSRRRSAEFQHAISETRRAVQQHELSRAGDLLARLSTDFSAEPDGAALISQLRSELESAERAEALSAYIDQVREFMRQQWLPEALDLVDEALRRFPGDAALIELRESVAEQQHAAAVAAVLNDASAHRQIGDLETALALLEQGRRQFGDERAFAGLLGELETELAQRSRADGLRAVVESARALIASGRHADAIRALAAATEYSEEAELKAVLETAQAAALAEEHRMVKSATHAAAGFEQQAQWDLATKAIQEALRRYPQNATLAQELERLRGEKRTHRHLLAAERY